MDIGKDVQKWVMAFVGLVVLGMVVGALFPMVTELFQADGTVDNGTGNSFTGLIGLVPTILAIVFVVGLIAGVIALISRGRNR
jgi:hypothetical protein